MKLLVRHKRQFKSDEAERITIHPNPDMLLRRDAIVPEVKHGRGSAINPLLILIFV